MQKTRKATFLRDLQAAFANSDTDFVADHVTHDIRWEIVGDRVVEGRDEFVAALEQMEADEPMELTLDHIITDGDTASVTGTIGRPDGTGKTYAFCDVFTLTGSENPKVRTLTSYVIEVNR